MKYLNFETLSKIDTQTFRTRAPFPHEGCTGALTPEGFHTLVHNMPDISLFEKDFGSKRKYGQKPHDRYRLWYYKAHKKISEPWKEFIAELESPEYKQFISKLFGKADFNLRLEWHYTPSGCTVYPHLDGGTTYGSHLFYFNDESEWKKEWGGETLILKGKKGDIPLASNPEFEDFEILSTDCIGNNSVVFVNGKASWHGIKTILAPEGKYRKVFIAFIEVPEKKTPGIYAYFKRLIQTVFPKFQNKHAYY